MDIVTLPRKPHSILSEEEIYQRKVTFVPNRPTVSVNEHGEGWGFMARSRMGLWDEVPYFTLGYSGTQLPLPAGSAVA